VVVERKGERRSKKKENMNERTEKNEVKNTKDTGVVPQKNKFVV